MKKLIVVLLLAFMPGTVQARWYKASSDHFVVYADDNASDVQRFAEMLEKFHAAMELVTTSQADTPSPSNRVTIFAVGSDRNVRKLYGNVRSNVAGFYQSRAGGSVAFTPDVNAGWDGTNFSVTILLHEYAHHFLTTSSRFAMPRWMSEGAAEFFASAKFERDGTVWIGRPAMHRGPELFYSADVSLEELFDYELYQRNKSNRHDAYYGRSWLLYHYLTFSSERPGQLAAYARSMIAGKDSLAAAKEVFGDLDTLDKELGKYLKSRRMTAYAIGPERLSPSPVMVTALSEGASEMMDVIIQSKRGVTREEAEELVVVAREIAADYPNDAMVQAALAEAEFDAGNSKAAIEAADRAIAADPRVTDAYVQKGNAMFDLASDADDLDKAYTAAMDPFSRLNRLENDHPLPLIYYYRSFGERGVEPDENARHAIERAAELAPFDKSIWMMVGHMQAWEGKIALAISSLSPVANDPHGGGAARAAQFYIDALRAAPQGESFSLSSVIVPPEIDIPEVPAEE